jgi:5'-nucleotidase/UDP-sugar diphosphatase
MVIVKNLIEIKTGGKMKLLRIFIFFATIFISTNLLAAEKLLTIVHTNDLHSHLQGFSPEIDYRPDMINADKTVGGWSRIATVIKNTKKGRKNPVLTLDSGDFSMGSLFHMLAREESFELRLLKMMGYDAVTLGNHEFDLKPAGLARTLKAAKNKGGMPQIVFASAVFDKKEHDDDSLVEAFREVDVKNYTVLVRGGIKIGIFGIMGKDAAAVAPFAKPVTFRDPIEVSREMVSILREKEKVDIVICLSHSGLSNNPGKSEDEILASKVKGIDIIISGHSHALPKPPIQKGSTLIVHAWVYGKHVGVLDISFDGKKVTLKSYKTVPINSAIRGDAAIQQTIDGFKQKINKQFLAGYGLKYDQTIAQTNRDLIIEASESPLGNMIADSIRWYINKYDSKENDPSSRVAVAVESNGVIRDSLLMGKTGRITVGDLFRTIPLGIGSDDTLGYPLITFYLYGYELKRALEILTSVQPLKGEHYFLQISGLRFTYNPHRVIFDRVTSIEMGSEEEGYKPLNYSSSNRQLYRVAANIYNATFLKVVGSYTYHLLDIFPKDKKGNPVKKLSSLRVDADKSKPGIQELKQWQGVIDYVQSFKEAHGDGVAHLPEKYKGTLGRIVAKPSWNPARLISHPTLPTILALVFVGFIFCGIIFSITLIVSRKKRRRKRRRSKIIL